MTRGIRVLVMCVGLLATAAQVQAQFGGRGGAGGVSGTMLLQQKSVQDELKLTTDQVDKVKQVAEKMRGSFTGRPEGGDRQEAMKKLEEARQAADKEIGGILSADQSKRLKEIVLQQAGPMALARPDVAKDLGLTDEQQAKVKEITEGFSTSLRDQLRGGANTNREEARSKMESLRKETNDKLIAVLKDDQKKSWEKLLGEAFKGEIQRFGGNRPRNNNAQ